MHTLLHPLSAASLPFRSLAALSLALILWSPSLLAEDVTTSDGKTFKSVSVAGMDEGRVKLVHDAGVTWIEKGRLPPEFIVRNNIPASDPAKLAIEQANAEAQRKEMSVAAESQAKAAAALSSFTKAPPGSIGKPGTDVLHVSGTVADVLADGVVLRNWLNGPVEGPRGGGILNQKTKILIICDSSALVDGSRYVGIVYPAGRAEHLGSTVYRYAASPEIAVKLSQGTK